MGLLKQFFELLRAGLWGKTADASLFESGVNWQGVYELALHQTVIALVFDGIETLPDTLRPPRTLYMQWYTRVAQIEKANEHLNQITAELFPLYTRAGLTPILLKGQGIAVFYPRPEHRQCGDIDIYLGKKGYPLANRIIIEAGGTSSTLEDSVKHAGFDYKGAYIENHRIVISLDRPSSDRKLKKMVREALNGNESTYTITINGEQITIPPPNFNVVYIFLHAFHHFLSGGVGLRQLCDWARIIVTLEKEINPAEVETMLRELKLAHAAGVFATIAVNYLGLPAEKVPFKAEASREEEEMVLKDIFMTGNFGHHDQRVGPRPKGYWSGKWHTFTRAVNRCYRFRKIAGAEAIWYPFTLIKGTISIQWRHLKKRLNPTKTV